MSDEFDQDEPPGWPVNSPPPGPRYPVVRGDDETRYHLQRGWSAAPEPDPMAEEEEEARRRAREGAAAPASSVPSPTPAPVERVKAGEFFGPPAPGSIAATPAAQTPPPSAAPPSSSPVPGYTPFRWPEPSPAPRAEAPPRPVAPPPGLRPSLVSDPAHSVPPVPPPTVPPVAPEAKPSGLRQGFNNLLRGALDSGLGSAAQGINSLAGNVLEYAPKPIGDALALGTALAYPENFVAAWSLDPARLKESQVHNYRNNAGLVEEGRKQVREALPVTQEFAESLPGQLTGAVGQAAGTLPLYALGPLGAMATVGQTYDQARADAEAHELTGEAAHKAALWNLPAAAIDVLADKFVVGRFLKGAQGKLSIGKFLTHLGESGAFNGLSAGAQQAWSNFAAKNLSGYDPERKIDEGVVRAFVTALATGHLVTGTGRLVGAGRALAERRNSPSPDAAREGHAPPPPDPRPPAVSHPDDALLGRETIPPFAAEHLGPAGRLREPSRPAPSEPRGVPSAGEGIVPKPPEETIPPARPQPDPKPDEPNGAGKPAPELPGETDQTPGKPTPEEAAAGRQSSPEKKPVPRNWGEVDAHADTGATVETRNGKRGVVTAIGEHTVRFRKEDGTIDAAHRKNARIIPRAEEEGTAPSLRPAEVEASPSPTMSDEPPATSPPRSGDLANESPEPPLESTYDEPPAESPPWSTTPMDESSMPEAESPTSEVPPTDSPSPATAPEPARPRGDIIKGDVGQTVEDRKGRRGIIYQVGIGGAVAARGADGQAFGIPPGQGRIVEKQASARGSNPIEKVTDPSDGRAIYDLIDATDDLDSYHAKMARNYYDPGKLDRLENGLAKFGVDLDADAEEILRQRGIGACFEIAEGRLTMRIRRGATFREVFHELAHVETYRRLLKEAGGDQAEAIKRYAELGRARREVEVYEAWMKRPKNWERLSDDQKKLETKNRDIYLQIIKKGQS